MIAIIINPVSGGRRGELPGRRAARARAALDAAKLSGTIALTERRGHARELAARAADAGARLVVAWGGDGTINEVGSALVGRRTALGIVPSGSGNGLATELGIDRVPERALADAFAAVPRAIDAGELDGRLFFNVAGIGFDARVALGFDRQTGGRRGFATYVRVGLGQLVTYRSETYRLDGAAAQAALLIAFANAPQYGNGVRIAPSARIDDGLLDLVVFRERSRLATCLAVPRLFDGTAARVKGVTMKQVSGAVVEADRPILFHVDGEPVEGGTRLEARVRPAALHVAVR